LNPTITVICNVELCSPLGTVQNFYLGECTLIVGVRNRLKNKDIGKLTYYHNNISVSADKTAWIMKTPQSTSWYFRMWILGMIKSRKRLFVMFFRNAAIEWLDVQKEISETGLIVKERLNTLKT
jgi:hypothetical protein